MVSHRGGTTTGNIAFPYGFLCQFFVVKTTGVIMYDRKSLYLTREYRQQLTAGYDELIQDHINASWEPYFLSFMFNHVSGSIPRKMEIMKYEVGRVYSILTRQVVRWPDRNGWKELRPKFIGSPDLPVYKHEKELVRNLKINDGLHYHVVALMPPTRRTLGNAGLDKVVYGRQSRLLVPLKQHLRDEYHFYHNEALSRIHAAVITKGTMAEYTLKAFKSGRVEYDAIQVWK